MIEIGKIDEFVVVRDGISGFYLRKPNSEGEVFMPPSMAPTGLEVNQQIRAFVYLDTKANMVATSKLPSAVVGEYALMKVVDVQEFGAFFDWGIEKDLLVPGNEQKVKVKSDEYYIVRVCLEEESDRIYGTTKIGRYIKNSKCDLHAGNKVSIVPAQKSDLGYRVIINKKFIGMIYSNEIYSDIQVGNNYEGVIKKIRSDGLVDVSLQSLGVKNLVDAKNKIIDMLVKGGGKSNLSDKSSPADIKQMLGMSKKTFKNAIGMLYRERKIVINRDGIELVHD